MDENRQTREQVERRDSVGRFAAGHHGGPGRPEGTPNRTMLLRQQLEEAVAAAGGQDWINRVVRDDPKLALKLLAGLQPKTAFAETTTPPSVQVVMYKEKPPDSYAGSRPRRASDKDHQA